MSTRCKLALKHHEPLKQLCIQLTLLKRWERWMERLSASSSTQAVEASSRFNKKKQANQKK